MRRGSLTQCGEQDAAGRYAVRVGVGEVAELRPYLDDDTAERVRPLIISHPFSTVRMADRVVEEGPHEDLLTRGGDYAELFRVQTEG